MNTGKSRSAAIIITHLKKLPKMQWNDPKPVSTNPNNRKHHILFKTIAVEMKDLMHMYRIKANTTSS